MAKRKKADIMQMKEKAAEKLSQLMESENEQISFRSCTAILNMDGEAGEAAEASLAAEHFRILADMINEPAADRGPEDD